MSWRRPAAAITAIALIAIVVALLVADDDPTGATVTGVVIQVEGDLTDVESFEIRLDDRTSRVFVPAPGVLFDGESSLGHLREHIVTGQPVEVRYEMSGQTYVATSVGDA